MGQFEDMHIFLRVVETGTKVLIARDSQTINVGK